MIAWWLRSALLVAALVCGLAPVLSFAEQSPIRSEITDFKLHQAADGLLLSTTMRFELPDQVEDALYKGIAMYFVAESQIVRERWYWSDKVVAQATRHMRLSYQPLTRRWRLSQSSTPFADSGLGVSLGQNFDELSDALAIMQRIARWNVAEGDVLDDNGTQTLHFQFRLDMSQLPRPLQLSTVGRSGWSLILSRSVRLTSSTVEIAK
ncbi:DUF4390 domain-containing protein [Diaphorobacter sp. HDW4A]|nr:DUF4390 domain-containing protein [Diaphorobacter sp. HDW4A]